MASLVIYLPPALITLFDIFRERVNQIEYNQWEGSAPALLASTGNGGYTRDPHRVPPHIHVGKKKIGVLASRQASLLRRERESEEERRGNEVETPQPTIPRCPPANLPGGHLVPSCLPCTFSLSHLSLFGGKNSRL